MGAAAAAALAAAAGGYAGFSFLAARRLLRPPRLVGEWHPGVLGLRYEDFEVAARDGVVLRGWFVRPRSGDSGATVMVLHGFTRSRWDDKYMCPAVYMLTEAGFNVAVYDQRGHGLSGGRTSLGAREVDDALVVAGFLRRRYPGETRSLGVLGFSLGGAVAVMLAARGEGFSAVVADSPYVDIVESARGWIRRSPQPLRGLLLASFPLILRFASMELGVSPRDLSIRPLARGIRVPLLIVAGERDDLVPLESIRGFYEAARGAGAPVSLWVTGAGHVESLKLYPGEYRERVVGFLRRWMRVGEA